MLQTYSLGVHLSREVDSFRPPYLLPSPRMPTEYVPRRHTQLSPLCPPNASGGRGMEKTQFEAMLQASRERSTMLGVRKPVELRKEIAVKAQKAKQLQRRARFLKKLCEPPSPSAADSPVTPPDSPTIFHFTLPSPGLQSPLELFEDMHEHPERYENTKRIEQVDFRLPYKKRVKSDRHWHCSPPIKTCVSLLPSLDQISQRLNMVPMSVPCSAHCLPSERGQKEKSRLPSFLQSRPLSSPPEATPSANDQLPRRSRPAQGHTALYTAAHPQPLVTQSPMLQHAAFPGLLVPVDKGLVESQITPLYPPLRSSKSFLTPYNKTTQFDTEQSGVASESTATTVMHNIPTPGLRAQIAKDMFNKLSRRTPGLPNAAAYGIKARDDTSLTSLGSQTEDKLRRRSSAPARVPTAQCGVYHPVLEKPGGF